ncbi:unnamed protein product [Alopecurus aequalis]
MMASGSALRVVESCLVTPSEETPRGGLWLSALDLALTKRGHTPVVLVYSASATADDDFFNVAKLKESLAKALVPFYPLAGRLSANSEDGRIEVNCNGEGAHFRVAYSDDHTAEGLITDPAPSMELVKLFKPRVEQTILLAVQVTFLRCGGVVLGISMHHAAGDGSSMGHIIRTWASYCRDGEGAVIELPCHDRALLRARSPPVIHPETMPMLSSGLTMHTELVAASKVFTISSEQLHALKRHCGGTSTFCTLSALVWKCVCVAHGLAPDATTRINFPVDIRRRLRPPLPAGYFGNGVINVFATAATKDVVYGMLSSVASRVKAASERLNSDEVLRSAIDYLEMAGPEDIGNLPETVVRVNSWFQLRMYEADFGWGKPRVTLRAGAVRGGWVYLLPETGGHGGGGVELLVYLEAPILSKFDRAVTETVCGVQATERARL